MNTTANQLETSLAAGDALTLETILDAWHSATQRLQQTHEALRCEVRRLSDELETKNRQLERKNRLADLGQMASHVAHEVRNSLVPITLYLSLLRRRLDNPGDLDVLDKMESGFTALEATVSDLLQFTSQHDPQCTLLDINALLEEICQSLRPQLDAQGIDVAVDAPRGLTYWGDRDMLRRAVLNLVLNALDAMPDGGELSLVACRSAGGLEIEVADSGPGICLDRNDRVFEPFFTTKSGGTGLGLAIVSRVAEVHGGEVTIDNCPQGGAAFTLRLPIEALEKAA